MTLTQRVIVGAVIAVFGIGFTFSVTAVTHRPTRTGVNLPQENTQSHQIDQPRERLLGRKIEDFELQDVVSDKPWRLSTETQDAEIVVLYFNTTECPVTNRYLPKLNEIQTNYSDKKVLIVAVNSNVHDTKDEIKNHAAEFEVNFEVLHDANGTLARSLNVTRTAEVFVLDAKRKVRYRGVVDDRFERGVTRPKVTHDYLKDSITSVLAGREVEKSITNVTACPLELAPIDKGPEAIRKITYSEHAAAIIQRRCQACHRSNGIGPFELMTFDDAKSWSTSIREVISQELMPPWHADAPHGHFANDRSLTDDEYKTLLDWIDGGAVEGDKSKLPKPRSFPGTWNIGKPDLVIKMDKSMTVPAQTPKFGVPYKYIWVGEPFDEEKWVKAAEVHPGASEVVHHVIAYIVPEGVEIKLVNDERPSDTLSELTSPINELPFLVAFVPGDNAFVHPDGLAKRIPKGSRILFEMHYTPTGKKATDCSELGLVFADKPPKHEVLAGGAINYWFSIPPGAENHPVKANTERFKRDSVLLSMNPHMHFRGKSFKYELVERSGKRTLLLNVPNYNFDWQSTYWLAKPIDIPKDSYIRCSATFDNSKDNPFNPDPTVRVTWGEQTWQEMMLASLEFYEK